MKLLLDFFPILLFFAVLRMSHRHRPAACLAGAYLLLLIDTSRGPDGEPIAGPIGGLAAFIIIGVMVAVWSTPNTPTPAKPERGVGHQINEAFHFIWRNRGPRAPH